MPHLDLIQTLSVYSSKTSEPYSLAEVPVIVAGDFDGCISHEEDKSLVLDEAENLFRQNKLLKEFFKDCQVEGFYNASLRQSPDIEEENIRKSRLAVKSWFPLMEKFTEKMGWHLVPWLLTDVFSQREPGKTLKLLQSPTEVSEKISHKCVYDTSKLLIAFGQIQHIANERQRQGKDGKFVYVFMDDKAHILSDLYDFLEKFLFIIPIGVQIHFIEYNGFREPKRNHFLQGSGKIFSDYSSLMHKMVEVGQDEKNCWVESFCLIRNIEIELVNESLEVMRKGRIKIDPLGRRLSRADVILDIAAIQSDDSICSDMEDVDSIEFRTPPVKTAVYEENPEPETRSPIFAQDSVSPNPELPPRVTTRSKLFIFSHLSSELFKEKALKEESSRTLSAKSSLASPKVPTSGTCLPPIFSIEGATGSYLSCSASLFRQGSRKLPVVSHLTTLRTPQTSIQSSSFMLLPPLAK